MGWITAIFAFFKGWKTVAIVIGLAVIAFCAWRIVRTLFPPPPPEPRIVRYGPYTVSEVTSGAGGVVAYGRKDRREKAFTLIGVSAPAKGQWLYSESLAGLEACLGGTATIDVEKEHWGRPDWNGVVYGDSGQMAQVEQLRAGLVRLTDAATADKVWREAEAEAKKAKRGLWGKPPKSDVPAGWDEWWTEHKKTCKLCGNDIDGPAPLCEEAFEKYKELMRKEP